MTFLYPSARKTRCLPRKITSCSPQSLATTARGIKKHEIRVEGNQPVSTREVTGTFRSLPRGRKYGVVERLARQSSADAHRDGTPYFLPQVTGKENCGGSVGRPSRRAGTVFEEGKRCPSSKETTLHEITPIIFSLEYQTYV
jgi:hypothetical protein